MREFNEQRDKGVFISSIITAVGAFLVILGLVVPYAFLPNLEYVEIFIGRAFIEDGEWYHSIIPLSLAIAIVAGIIMLVAILSAVANSSSSSRSKYKVFSKPYFVFFLLVMFFLFPSATSEYGYYYSFISSYYPMFAYLAGILTIAGDELAEYSMRDPSETSYMAYGPGFFFLIFGIVLLIFGFFWISYQTIGVLGKNKSLIRPSSNTSTSSTKVFDKVILVILAICCFGIMLGVAAPYYMWLDRNPPHDYTRYESLMFFENEHDGNYRAYLNYHAFFYVILYLFLFVAIILYLIKDKLTWRVPVNRRTIIFFLIFATLTPYPNPFGFASNWVPSVMVILSFFEYFCYYARRDWIEWLNETDDVVQVMSPIGWILLISSAVIIAVTFLFIGTTLLRRYQSRGKSKGEVDEVIEKYQVNE